MLFLTRMLTFVSFSRSVDHTFRTADGSEFGCEAFPNDYVSDTPAHQGDSFRFDCRQYIFPNNQPFPDTCPNLPGRDPVLK